MSDHEEDAGAPAPPPEPNNQQVFVPQPVFHGIYGSVFPYKDGDNWTEYVEIYEHYFHANNITKDSMKVSILCSQGPFIYKNKACLI